MQFVTCFILECGIRNEERCSLFSEANENEEDGYFVLSVGAQDIHMFSRVGSNIFTFKWNTEKLSN